MVHAFLTITIPLEWVEVIPDGGDVLAGGEFGDRLRIVIIAVEREVTVAAEVHGVVVLAEVRECTGERAAVATVI